MSAPADARATPFRPGVVLDDRFLLVRRLGTGGFGEVWQARQQVFGHDFRDVALKLFHADRVDAGNARTVLNDAVVLLQLQEEDPTQTAAGGLVDVAPYLVRVYDLGMTREPCRCAYMAMQLVRGGQTLASLVSRYGRAGGMPPAIALRYLRQLLLPLAWMHTLAPPLVHGDLKPANVLLDPDDRLVLTDFGLAARLPLTVTGGTVAYLAAERLQEVDAGPESDVFAVGLMWYEMLTGRHPFADVGLAEQAAGDRGGEHRAHLRARGWPIAAPARAGGGDRIPPVDELNREMADHPQLVAMLHRCLAKLPSARYPNARVLLDQVERYLRDGTLTASELEILHRADAPTALPGTVVIPARSGRERLADARTRLCSGDPARALAEATQLAAQHDLAGDAALVRAEALAKLGRGAEALTVVESARGLVAEAALLEAKAAIFADAGKDALARTLRQRAAALRADPPRAAPGRCPP